MQHTGSISPVRNVDRILQRARGKQWMVEGFAVDDPPRAFVRPHEWVYSAPSHLECLFEPCSTKAETLQLATDPVANGVTEEEIEKTAFDVLLILDNWSQGVDVAAIVECLPFGSKFMLVEKHPQGPHVYLVPNFELQRRCLSARRLQELWADKETVLPPCVDLQHIKAIRRLSDSVSLVSVGHEKVVLKAITNVISRMYHEIRVLLQMPPHPNVISRPSYLVTRKGRDDAEALVCGFIVEYHSGGSLSDVLPTRERSGTLMYSDQIKWSKQLLSAFRHIHGPAKSFYSDIKLDNIILSDTDDLILTDFEQIGTREVWKPPELDRKAELQGQSSNSESDWSISSVNPACRPEGIHYSNRPLGYNKDYITCTDRERQNIEVYGLAKVLWCIFEGRPNEVSRKNLSTADLNLLGWDGKPLSRTLFPAFSRTPKSLRYWIWLCTKQSLEWGADQCTCDKSTQVCGDVGARMGGCADFAPSRPDIAALQHMLEYTF